MIAQRWRKGLARAALCGIALLLLTGCEDGDDDNGDTVLLHVTLQSPPVSASAFTTAGTYVTQEDGPIIITVTPSNANANVLIHSTINNGFASNQEQFDSGNGNPATLTINNQQTGIGHAVMILDPNAEVGTTYTVTVTQSTN